MACRSSYSLNTFMPIEGYQLAFNGHRGRIEIHQRERQPWRRRTHDEVLVMRNFGEAERITVPHEPAAISAAIRRCRGCCLARPGDPLGQRAGARAGALSVLCGIAAVESADSGRPIKVRLPELPS